ncbi:peptidoglycan bridge formation glycyltransferase FemA/FemB family protein [Psychrobacter sp. AOP7-B1-25]|uniref:peptidoglycan bridge formation glycyltransferase FemA/FemB family protein n=1 Tax=Psychrobacter sp. AOP7-B1-25 TaxID=3457644 RepID=UPI00402BE7AB
MDKVNIHFTEIDYRWDQEISEHIFDIYHLSGWINSSTGIDKGKSKGIVAEYRNKKLFLPIIIRTINNEYWDATSPYGYGGPVVDSSLTDGEVDIILKSIKTFLHREGCVSLFVRLNPITNKKWSTSIGSSITHGLTLISDLAKSEAEHWQETQNQHRRGIKKALNNNIITKIESFTEERINMFAKIYRETMLKVEAEDYYYFDDSYFQKLSTNIQNRLLLITAYENDIAIASSIYTICEETGIMQFYLGGTTNKYRDLQPSKLITHIARNWGRKNGYKILHFGGGVGSTSDSLYRYKRGFSSQELLFKTWRLITNSEKYKELVILTNEIAELKLESGFFPLYRDTTARTVDHSEKMA